jgi:hypothetical protein
MEAVSANGAGGETAALSAFGRQWGTAEMFALGRRANENPPKLYTFNPKGFRRDVVEFHPAQRWPNHRPSAYRAIRTPTSPIGCALSSPVSGGPCREIAAPARVLAG